MTERIPTKWAITEGHRNSEPDVIDIDEIEQAITDDELLTRALFDAIEAFARLTMVGRSIPEAITRLESWRRTFEKGIKP